MDSKRKDQVDFNETKVHKDLGQTKLHNINNQETIFGSNNRIKNEMRKQAGGTNLGDTMAPGSGQRQRRKSSKDNSLDFDPFLDETIYDVKYKKENSNNSFKFIFITLAIAVIVCIAVFAFAFKVVLNPNTGGTTGGNSSSNNQSNTNGSGNEINGNDDISESILSENLVNLTGIITKYDISNNTIVINDINNGSTHSFVIDGKTKLYDQYEKTIVFAELSVGDVVDVTFDSSSVYISELRKNENTFSNRRVTGVEIDTSLNTITYNGKTYDYNSNIITIYNDEPYDIKLFNPKDTVTFSGYKNTVYKIELLKGHGTISFINIDTVENGVVEIDTDTLFNLNSQTEVTVTAGDHNLVIKGDNIDTYTNKIFVEKNETLEIDLSNLPSKKGLLVVKSNASNMEIAIDGEIYTEPIMLPYGSYVVTVSANDYVSASKNVVVDKSSQEVTFNLDVIEKNARLILDTAPTGAEVYVDNRLIGLTPIDQKIEIGLRTVTLRLDGYDDFTYTRQFDEDTYRLTFTLTPKESSGTTNIIEDSTNVDEELIIP